MLLGLARIVGHRGAALRAPENTLAGFRKAAELGAGWVELDVMLTRDGVPVVIHDETLDRTTDRTGRIEASDWRELADADAGIRFAPAFAGERVPLLSEALAVIAGCGMGVNIEIKPCPGRERETALEAVATAKACWPGHLPPPLFSSFKRPALAAAQEAMPEWPRGLLLDRHERDWRAAAEALGCRAINPNWKHLTPKWVSEIKAAGLAVVTWTCNLPEEARRLVGLGVDAVITDAPDLLVPAIGGM
ncbi:MAG: glycerophosphodiester phosphodiesterase [Proteobacteria bacterium]|nr:glycerophosphodiester phosphodiesterase [Pseudomonadota bacterium]MBI3499024.1 glycerophosphodiester phosphodiesterase [Pseudomonadota bacterium]